MSFFVVLHSLENQVSNLERPASHVLVVIAVDHLQVLSRSDERRVAEQPDRAIAW